MKSNIHMAVVMLFLPFALSVAAGDCSNCYADCPGEGRKSCVQTEQPSWCTCECMNAGPLDCVCDCFRADQQQGGECCSYGKKQSCGCPFLYSYASGVYNLENSLLPASQHSNGLVVVDNLLLDNPLTLYNGNYPFLICEYEDNKHSFFDQVKLMAVDRPKTVNIGATFGEKILTWNITKDPDFCVDNYGNDQLKKILNKDGESWQGQTGDYLILGFIGVGEIPGWGNGAALQGCFEIFDLVAAVIKLIFKIFSYTPQGNLIWIGDFYGRQKPSPVTVSIPSPSPSPFLSQTQFPETLRIKIQLDTPGSFDQIQLTNGVDTSIIIQECPLAYAQNEEGDIFSALLSVDSVYAELPPHSYFELGFLPLRNTVSEGWKRDFVLVSTGRYTTREEGSITVGEKVEKKPPRFDFTVRPTNFRSYTNITYVLPERARVLLGVYDISGRLVANLENRIADAGRYSILWDGSDDRGEKLSAGSYFVKLNAGEFSQTKKIVLVR